MRYLVSRILNIIFPITCVSCHADLPFNDELRVCLNCSSRIRLIEGLICRSCGRPLDDGGAHCYNCRKEAPKYIEFIRSACVFEGITKELVHQFKYFGKDYLSVFLTKYMLNAFYNNFRDIPIDALAPVPIHWSKTLLRGYNQSEALSDEISRILNIPSSKVLLKKRITRSQVGLTKGKRSLNIADSFSVKRGTDVTNKNILVIDDVCTTGSTLIECAKTLKNAGAGKVFALTFARD